MKHTIKVIEEMISECQTELALAQGKWESASEENRVAEMIWAQKRIQVLNDRISVLTKYRRAWDVSGS